MGGRECAGRRGIKGKKKWDNSIINSIINKIYLKKIKALYTVKGSKYSHIVG